MFTADNSVWFLSVVCQEVHVVMGIQSLLNTTVIHGEKNEYEILHACTHRNKKLMLK